MKFGKSLFQVIELSDPEWGPYWINYKYLKKKINEIVIEQQENRDSKQQQQQQQQKHHHHRGHHDQSRQEDPSSSTEIHRHQHQSNEQQSEEDENNIPNESHGKILKQQLSQSNAEVEFFKLLKKELKKTSDFFATSEILCKIRKERLWGGLEMLKNQNSSFDDTNAWTRLMASCVRFYKDVLLLENYAIMNYCGFSKILKKHDKRTG
jgi:SPX domain protein involved in polyphosphate accumulation